MKKEVMVMNIEESIQQIETLIEAWQLDEADLNQTDINAMETLLKENEQLKEEKRKVRDYINKHCVNEKISKEVGYKCYTMADTNELEKIMKILGDNNEKRM